MAFMSADEAIGTTPATVNLTVGYLDDKISGLSAYGLQRSFVSFSSIDRIWAMRFARVSGFLAE
ncbi:hypothetical protein HDF10_003498 [Edaphobacter lichenicola]|uniref:Uncharacterized protein n=1 Tax=Tunturiibacter lichenicola TaxID=2051959 RepID=A0A7W8JA75_9BACT|nr:hypothetical protein [Edaphobacter lichenicola]